MSSTSSSSSSSSSAPPRDLGEVPTSSWEEEPTKKNTLEEVRPQKKITRRKRDSSKERHVAVDESQQALVVKSKEPRLRDQDRDSSRSRDVQTFPQGRRGSSKERRGSSKERRASSKERRGSSKERRGVSKERVQQLEAGQEKTIEYLQERVRVLEENNRILQQRLFDREDQLQNLMRQAPQGYSEPVADHSGFAYGHQDFAYVYPGQVPVYPGQSSVYPGQVSGYQGQAPRSHKKVPCRFGAKCLKRETCTFIHPDDSSAFPPKN